MQKCIIQTFFIQQGDRNDPPYSAPAFQIAPVPLAIPQCNELGLPHLTSPGVIVPIHMSPETTHTAGRILIINQQPGRDSFFSEQKEISYVLTENYLELILHQKW